MSVAPPPYILSPGNNPPPLYPLLVVPLPPTYIYIVSFSSRCIIPVEYPPFPPLLFPRSPPCAPHVSNL